VLPDVVTSSLIAVLSKPHFREPRETTTYSRGVPLVGGMREISNADWWDATVMWQLTPLSLVTLSRGDL